jgi:ATP-dependent Zn protease
LTNREPDPVDKEKYLYAEGTPIVSNKTLKKIWRKKKKITSEEYKQNMDFLEKRRELLDMTYHANHFNRVV